MQRSSMIKIVFSALCIIGLAGIVSFSDSMKTDEEKSDKLNSAKEMEAEALELFSPLSDETEVDEKDVINVTEDTNITEGDGQSDVNVDKGGVKINIKAKGDSKVNVNSTISVDSKKETKREVRIEEKNIVTPNGECENRLSDVDEDIVEKHGAIVRFIIGGEPLQFVVRDEDAIDDMVDLCEGDDDKLILQGKVRKGREINDPWNFSIDANDVELTDDTDDLCKIGLPSFVEAHLDDYIDQYYCPTVARMEFIEVNGKVGIEF